MEKRWKSVLFTVVFAVICGLGISAAVYFAGTYQVPEAQTASVFNEPRVKVHVKGAVKEPGVYECAADARIQDAIFMAGGATEEAETGSLNLAAMVKDGQMIQVPSKNEQLGQTSPVQPSVEKNLGLSTEDDKININTANETELDQLPGIGPSLAKRIIAYREENGYFTSIEDLTNVSGIGEKKFEELKDKICI